MNHHGRFGRAVALTMFPAIALAIALSMPACAQPIDSHAASSPGSDPVAEAQVAMAKSNGAKGVTAKAIDKVNEAFPEGTPKVIIGHISARNGGHLKPHKSHQAGRDVDLSYFYKDNKAWYAVATEQNIDKARSWAFVRAFALDPNVEMILVDSSVQKILRAYALEQGEDAEFVDRILAE